MSRKQKKFEKKKEREKEKKAKSLKRRNYLNAAAKEERQNHFRSKSLQRVMRERIALEQWATMVENKIPEDTRKQILHNIEILKAMEEEYSKEINEKIQLQQSLQEKGCENLSDMMNYLHAENKPTLDQANNTNE